MSDHLAAKGEVTSALCPIEAALPVLFRTLDTWHEDFGAPFLIALSGGGDSVALCKLSVLWAQNRGARLHAVSIDHALRPCSAAEAVQAISWAEAMGISGEVITLGPKPPQGGLQEWARQTRYRTLATAAARIGAKIILVGHTWDDQIETLCWRLVRGTGLDGLAGMADLAANAFCAPDAPNLLGRPLLGMKRADLRAWLRRAGQAWLEDESNQNLDFARIRIRKQVAEMKAKGVDWDQLARVSETANALRTTQERAGRALLQRSGLVAIKAGWQLQEAMFLSAEPLIGERVLGWLIFSLTAAEHVPEASKLERLWSDLQTGSGRGRTLGGVQITRRKGQILLRPAPPRRGQAAYPCRTHQDQYARLFTISRQPHKIVTQ